jgi:hypothetical protein
MTEPWLPNYESELESTRDAEETLRLLSRLRPPEGLRERVHRRLDQAQAIPKRQGFWSFWSPSQRLQFVAASVLAVAVAGSMWSVYRLHPERMGQPGVGPAASPASQGNPAGDSRGFGTAGAVRVPPTLHPIKVPPAPKRKPNASRVIAKPSPKRLAAPSKDGGENPKPPADR